MQPITPELRAHAKIDPQEGAFIMDVMRDSPAAKAGIKQGDVITAIGGKAMKNPDEVYEAIQSGGAKELSLTVVRGNEKLNLKATPQSGNVSYFEPPGHPFMPSFDGSPMMDQSKRIRELERRIEELEKKLKESEHRK